MRYGDLVANLTRCEAANSANSSVNDNAQDDENRRCDEHPDDDRRTIYLRRVNHVNCPHRPNRNQDDAAREQGRGN
jgi:hypothetical protein